jgi:hypothetical protein
MRGIERSTFLNLILALFLAIFFFGGIFLFANSIAYLNYSSSIKENNAISEAVLRLEEASRNLSCQEAFIVDVSRDLEKISGRMDLLEERWGKKDARVIEQKGLYFELQKRHLEIILDLEKRCSFDFVPFLFFYSNGEALSDKSERVGFLLNSFKKKDLNRFMIYSFDYDMNVSVVEEYKKEFGVTSVPLVVDVLENRTFFPKNIKDFSNYLN